MKKKKKLSLNPETIAKLDNLFVTDVKGGTIVTEILSTVPTTTIMPVKGCIYDTMAPDFTNTYNCLGAGCTEDNCTVIPLYC